MHRILTPASGHGPGAFRLIAPNAIFYRPVTGLSAAASQVPAKKIANQLRYKLGSSGSFYGYSGVGYGNVVRANISDFSPSLFVVPPGQTRRKVAYTKTFTESGELRTESENTNLRVYLEEGIPLPTRSKVPSGVFAVDEAGSGGGENTDSEVTIWQPSTGLLVELAEVNMLNYSGKVHAHVPPEVFGMSCGYYGGVLQGAAVWDGVWTHPEWGSRATGLFMHGGIITLQDLVEVLEGKKIKHAIGVELQVVAEEVCAPAIRHDTVVSTNKQELIPAGSPEEGQPNPAYGSVDAVAEGRWFRFPPASSANEHFNQKTEPLAWAIYEAVREYGMFVSDGAAAPAFQIEPPVAMGSPYSLNAINPLTGAEGEGWPSKSQLSYVPAGMTSAALGHFKESIGGTSSCLTKQPWVELESIEPRAS